MAAILRNLEQLGRNFALYSRSTQDMCLQHIIRTSVKTRALGLGQGFEKRFWILPLLLMRRRQLQTYQTHIGQTLHVVPNNRKTPKLFSMNMAIIKKVITCPPGGVKNF